MKQKNLFMSMFAIASMLFATSCSQDELVNEPIADEYVSATFTIGTEDGMGSRTSTIGDASHVNWVACTIYDAQGTEMSLYEVIPFEQATNQATWNIRLAKGQDYRAAFFAYYGDATTKESPYYDVTNLKSIKIKTAVSNLENRDAFTGTEPISATDLTNLGSVEKNVELKRPFAQLNLGIDSEECTAAQKAGIVVTNTKIKVTDVWNAWSAYDNNIASDATLGEMTFDFNGIPEPTLYADANKDGTDESYTYLALNYLLVGDMQNTKSTTNVEFTWKTANNKTNNPVTSFIHMPVERNYRTNIVGKLLTTPTDFIITIDEEFKKPDHIENIQTVVTKSVATADELQAAINAAPVGLTTIKLGANITASSRINVTQKKDVQILIDGQNYTFDGLIFVAGQANYNGTEALTIQNVNFNYTGTYKNENDNYDIIQLANKSASGRYTHNITIKDCTFTAADNIKANVVALRPYQCFDVNVIGGSATGLHSFMQATGGDDIDVNGVTVNCIRGIALGTTTNCVVSNTTITTTGDDKYGIRHDAAYLENTLKIVNCTVNAFIPVVVRGNKSSDGYSTVNEYNLLFEGTNTLTIKNNGEFHVAVGKEEYDAVGKTITSFGDGVVTITGAAADWSIKK